MSFSRIKGLFTRLTEGSLWVPATVLLGTVFPDRGTHPVKNTRMSGELWPEKILVDYRVVI